jgi:hypothetical protein
LENKYREREIERECPVLVHGLACFSSKKQKQFSKMASSRIMFMFEKTILSSSILIPANFLTDRAYSLKSKKKLL